MRFSILLTIMGLFSCFGTHGEEAAKPMPGRRRLFGGAKANRSARLGRRLWPLVADRFRVGCPDSGDQRRRQRRSRRLAMRK